MLTSLISLLVSLSSTFPGSEKPPQPSEAELQKIWQGLHSADRFQRPPGYDLLLSVPEQTIPFFARQLKPAVEADQEAIDKWVAALGDPDFAVRNRAWLELKKLDYRPRAALQAALAKKLPLEAQRRVERLLHDITDSIDSNPELLRQFH